MKWILILAFGLIILAIIMVSQLPKCSATPAYDGPCVSWSEQFIDHTTTTDSLVVFAWNTVNPKNVKSTLQVFDRTTNDVLYETTGSAEGMLLVQIPKTELPEDLQLAAAYTVHVPAPCFNMPRVEQTIDY